MGGRDYQVLDPIQSVTGAVVSTPTAAKTTAAPSFEGSHEEHQAEHCPASGQYLSKQSTPSCPQSRVPSSLCPQRKWRRRRCWLNRVDRPSVLRWIRRGLATNSQRGSRGHQTLTCDGHHRSHHCGVVPDTEYTVTERSEGIRLTRLHDSMFLLPSKMTYQISGFLCISVS